MCIYYIEKLFVSLLVCCCYFVFDEHSFLTLFFSTFFLLLQIIQDWNNKKKKREKIVEESRFGRTHQLSSSFLSTNTKWFICWSFLCVVPKPAKTKAFQFSKFVKAHTHTHHQSGVHYSKLDNIFQCPKSTWMVLIVGMTKSCQTASLKRSMGF